MEKLKVNICFGYENPFLNVTIKESNPNSCWDKAHNWVHHHLYCVALQTMRKKGAKVGEDLCIKKEYPILNRFHGYGNWHGLEFKSEIHANNFVLEFFQNITPPENRNGGYYDFNKYKKFPYLIRLRLKVAINSIIAALKPMCDATVTFVDLPKKSEERVLREFRESCHKRKNILSLADAQYTLSDYDLCSNNKDRDKKEIKCGDLKYFYSYDGYLHRGIVYHNLNNMWWVIENDITLRNIASFDLFDRTDEPIRRVLSADKKLKRLIEERGRQIEAENFLRCSKIQREIDKLRKQME